MKYGSVCSGIEAASVAWHGLGWQAAWFSEIEKFPCAALAHHYPNTPNLGNMTRFKEWHDEPTKGPGSIELLVGGTPCQSFSLAGLRKGLADPRGNLMLTYLAIAERYRPRWVVWENVPGVLSSNGGRDFSAFLGGLGQLGYGFAYRVLDAQYFGVAQRRRRVFVVGYLGDWRPPAAVLFERESLRGHPAPRRKAGQGTARGFETGPGGNRFTDLAPTLDCRAKNGPMQNQIGAGVAQPLAAFGGNNTAGPIDVATAVNAKGGSGRQDFESETFAIHPRAVGRDSGGPDGKVWRDDGARFTMDTSGGGSVAHTLRANYDASEGGTGRGTPLVPAILLTMRDGKEGGARARCCSTTRARRWRPETTKPFSSQEVALSTLR